MAKRPIAMMTRCSAAALLVLASAAGAAHAQCGAMTPLLAPTPASGEWFGSAVAGYLSNGAERLMIGCRLDDTAAGGNAGSVYTFGRLDNNQWGYFAQLTANDGQVNDYFGTSVGVTDPYCVVGAPGAGVGGAAYFFTRTGPGWVQMDKQSLSSAAAGDDFGAAVAMDGTWAVVGAPGRDFGSINDAGAAYFFRRQSNGTYTAGTAVLGNNSLDNGSRLGSAVAMKFPVAVIGAPNYSQPAWPAQHGVVRVYRCDAASVWQWEEVLSSNNPGSGDAFGAAVATDGTLIAVGAPGDDRTEAQGGVLSDSGCVYIYRYQSGDWYFEQQIFAPDATAGAQFGGAVAIENDRLVVGTPGAKKAYVFRRIPAAFGYKWIADESITGPAGTSAATSFGNAVAITGQSIAIGDQLDDTSGWVNSGSVHVRRPSAAYSDSCEGAVAIGLGLHGGCTTFATRDGSTTCGNQAAQGPDVWFSWTPTCSGTARIDTLGSSFDTIISVHTACPSGDDTNTLACNDDGGGAYGLLSMLTFEAVANTTCLIRVTGYDGARGAFALTLQQAASNDTCATAAPITAGSHAFSTCAATTDGPTVTSCYSGTELGMYKDVWYRYTAECSGDVTITTCGSLFDTILAVYPAGECPTASGPSLACNDDSPGACQQPGLFSRVQFQAVAGQEYLIRIGGFNNAAGAGMLNISCTPTCRADWDGNGQVNSSDISAFLTTWLQSVTAPSLDADFNGDGATNSTDISAFLTAWLEAVTTGC